MSGEFNSFDEFSDVRIDAWMRLGKADFGRSTSDENLQEVVDKNTALRNTVGDVNSDKKGSGARYNSGKPDFSLIPLCTMADEARVWEYGAKKYSRNNWMKGMLWSIPFACLMRHMSAWQAGENLDPETGISHIAHAMCNLRMLTLFAQNYPEGDNRPKQWLADYRNDVKKEGEL